MGTKVLLLLGLSIAIVLAISSDVAAKELAETETTTIDSAKENFNEDRDHDDHGGYGGGGRGGYGGGGRGGYGGGGRGGYGGGGRGGYGGGGRGGYGGGRGGYGGNCRHGCCKDYGRGGCKRCCGYAGEAVEVEPEVKPHN